MWRPFLSFFNRTPAGAYNQQALVPQIEYGWDSWIGRLFRYGHLRNYYANTVYTTLAGYAAKHKKEAGLYKHTRGIYNPYFRGVELYVSKLYAGRLDTETFNGGAIPIPDADEAIKTALRVLYKASSWGTKKSLYARTGSMLGDGIIKLCDNRESQQIQMELLDPGKVKNLEFDSRGNIKRAIIEYNDSKETVAAGAQKPVNVETWVYTEEITEDGWTTYKDGVKFAYYENESGQKVSEWPNPYGFVPLVLCRAREMDNVRYGASVVPGAALSKIDECNDAASLLNDQVRKAVNVLWYFAGVQSQDELDVSIDKKDALNAVYGPEGSNAQAMISELDISGALENLKEMLAEVERDMPELSMYRMQQGERVTGPGVQAGYQEAASRIEEVRGAFDDALVRAQMMAMSMGAYNGYSGYEAFSVDSYRLGNLDHTIADRPVIPDSLAQNDKITHLETTGAPPEAIWKELGYDQDTIDSWKQLKEEQQAQQEAQMLAAARQQAALAGPPERPQIGAGANA